MTALPSRRHEPGPSLGNLGARLVLSLSLLAIAFAAPAAAHKAQSPATTFEVYVNAGTGDDSNAGTMDQPLRTLNRALWLAWRARHPGCVVSVRWAIDNSWLSHWKNAAR